MPLLGRVSMDMTIFDITDCHGTVAPGDMIELLGPQQSLDDLAIAAGTSAYEILTSLGSRYQRHYLSPVSA